MSFEPHVLDMVSTSAELRGTPVSIFSDELKKKASSISDMLVSSIKA